MHTLSVFFKVVRQHVSARVQRYLRALSRPGPVEVPKGILRALKGLIKALKGLVKSINAISI